MYRSFSFMSWIGGKKALRELIVTLFPVYYERYIEVFGGGGWVLFHKPPGNDFEVYNDFNSLLVNLYRCVREKPEELMAELRYVLNAREDFDRIRSALARDSPAGDVRKAAWFYQLIRYSYASGLTSFGSQPHDIWSNFPLIEQAHRRLAKVVIENKDFEKLIRQYDRPVSFFYLDPPYRQGAEPARGGSRPKPREVVSQYGGLHPDQYLLHRRYDLAKKLRHRYDSIPAGSKPWPEAPLLCGAQPPGHRKLCGFSEGTGTDVLPQGAVPRDAPYK